MRRPTARSAASFALIAAGSALLVISAVSVARGAMARETARTLWAEATARHAAAGARTAAERTGVSVNAPGMPVARLVIEKLRLDEVVVEGLTDDALRAGPGHMTGSALPGDIGNAVISAHRDRHFHALGAIAMGDTIVTESARGTLTWRVARIRVVDADAPALRLSKAPMLTLTTCWPIRYFGPAPDRLIVEAELLGNRELGIGNRVGE